MNQAALIAWQTFDDDADVDRYGSERGLVGSSADGLLTVRLALTRDYRRMDDPVWRVEVSHDERPLTVVRDAAEVSGRRHDAPLPLAAVLAMVPVEQHVEVLNLHREHIGWLEQAMTEALADASTAHAGNLADSQRRNDASTQRHAPWWACQLAKALHAARLEDAVVGHVLRGYSATNRHADYQRLLDAGLGHPQ